MSSNAKPPSLASPSNCTWINQWSNSFHDFQINIMSYPIWCFRTDCYLCVHPFWFTWIKLSCSDSPHQCFRFQSHRLATTTHATATLLLIIFAQWICFLIFQCNYINTQYGWIASTKWCKPKRNATWLSIIFGLKFWWT